ncbi:hypothetical protein C2G38_2224763 [Gigaspora rosea]|uniref:Uncharacterized protein n=1 Tax=Gigaspora rosea TaxID=44941 RepID=A0A397U8V4_9GLOM|nr:hypothetical protein C2G38_2224763 [Gigaspora rosea]
MNKSFLNTCINSRASYLSSADYKNIMQYRDMKSKPLAQLTVTPSTNVIDKQNKEHQAERDFQNKFIVLKNKIHDDKISKYTNPVSEESADSKTKKTGVKKRSQGDHTKSASTSELTIPQNQPMSETKKLFRLLNPPKMSWICIRELVLKSRKLKHLVALISK